MSGVASSFQHIAPGPLTRPAPMLLFGSQIRNQAPCGSWMTAIRPTSITSNAGAWTVPPSSVARFAVSSALCTVM